MSVKPLEPLRFDDHPRWCEIGAVCVDISEGAVEQALNKLRPMAQARGYNNRDITLADCVLVCSERWRWPAEQQQKRVPGLRVQTVPPCLLKTEGAWALIFGLDSVVSFPPW